MALVPGEIVKRFGEQYRTDAKPELYRAPGRVNLIGEHTDYNLGFVFPIALEMACYVAIAPATQGRLDVYSRDVESEFSIPLDQIPNAEPLGVWSDYVLGVARELVLAGVKLKGADLYIASDVPAGSGLSSSAAIEIASAIALLGTDSMPPLEIALLGQRAESKFVGMPCGIMDQYASVFGRQHAAMQIDCRNLTHEYVTLPGNVRIVAVNSMVKHELGSSAYRDRVAECAAAVEAIRQKHPGVESLRDVSPALFEEVQGSIAELPRRRARHIVTENQRVVEFGAAARAQDLKKMGQLFVASHRSMQYDYDITCEEVDFLVDEAVKMPGVYGARMTGGGFGGCTVNLVAPEQVMDFRTAMQSAYMSKFGIDAVYYDCEPSRGAGRLS